jgi:hypothetical protein
VVDAGHLRCEFGSFKRDTSTVRGETRNDMLNHARALIFLAPLYALGGCVAETSDGAGPTPGVERELVGTYPVGCQVYSADAYRILLDGTYYKGDGFFCTCEQKSISQGGLRLDDPYASHTFFCRPIAGCQKYSADKVNIKVSTDPDVFLPGEGYPCECPAKDIYWGGVDWTYSGKLRRDDPYAASTFFCRRY